MKRIVCLCLCLLQQSLFVSSGLFALAPPKLKYNQQADEMFRVFQNNHRRRHTVRRRFAHRDGYFLKPGQEYRLSKLKTEKLVLLVRVGEDSYGEPWIMVREETGDDEDLSVYFFEYASQMGLKESGVLRQILDSEKSLEITHEQSEDDVRKNWRLKGSWERVRLQEYDTSEAQLRKIEEYVEGTSFDLEEQITFADGQTLKVRLADGRTFSVDIRRNSLGSPKLQVREGFSNVLFDEFSADLTSLNGVQQSLQEALGSQGPVNFYFDPNLGEWEWDEEHQRELPTGEWVIEGQWVSHSGFLELLKRPSEPISDVDYSYFDFGSDDVWIFDNRVMMYVDEGRLHIFDWLSDFRVSHVMTHDLPEQKGSLEYGRNVYEKLGLKAPVWVYEGQQAPDLDPSGDLQWTLFFIPLEDKKGQVIEQADFSAMEIKEALAEVKAFRDALVALAKLRGSVPAKVKKVNAIRDALVDDAQKPWSFLGNLVYQAKLRALKAHPLSELLSKNPSIPLPPAIEKQETTVISSPAPGGGANVSVIEQTPVPYLKSPKSPRSPMKGSLTDPESPVRRIFSPTRSLRSSPYSTGSSSPSTPPTPLRRHRRADRLPKLGVYQLDLDDKTSVATLITQLEAHGVLKFAAPEDGATQQDPLMSSITLDRGLQVKNLVILNVLEPLGGPLQDFVDRLMRALHEEFPPNNPFLRSRIILLGARDQVLAGDYISSGGEAADAKLRHDFLVEFAFDPNTTEVELLTSVARGKERRLRQIEAGLSRLLHVNA